MKPILFTFLLTVIFLFIPITQSLAQAPNDDLCDADTIQIDIPCSGIPNGNNIGTTQEAGEPAGSCYLPFANTQSAWFVFQADSAGFVNINLAPNVGSLLGASLAVFRLSGSCSNAANLTELACANPSFAGGTFLEQFPTEQDSVYYIQVVGSFFAAEGDFCIEIISSVPPLPPPANDTICHAITLVPGDSCLNGTTESATAEAGEPEGSCFPGFSTTLSVWYSFTGPDTNNILLSLETDSGSFSLFAVYQLNSGDTCANFNALTEIACGNSFGGFGQASVLTDSGETYFVQVITPAFSNGNEFCISVDELIPPSNDQACQAILLPTDGSTQIFSNLGAGTDPGESAIAPPQGGNSGSWFDPVIDNSLWFRFVVPPSGAVEIELCDSATNFDTQIAVYQTGDCADYSTFSLLDANDDKEEGCLIGDQFSSYLANCFTPGDTLYLLVDGFEGEEGEFGITLTEVTVSPLFAIFNTIDQGCSNTASGAIEAIVNGGLGEYQYLWSNGSTAAINDGLLPGTYTVMISDNCGNTLEDTLVVNPAVPLIVDGGPDQFLCLGDSIILGGNPAVSGGLPLQLDGRAYGVVATNQGELRLFNHPLGQPQNINLSGNLSGVLNAADFTPMGLMAIDAFDNTLVIIDTVSGVISDLVTVNIPLGFNFTGLSWNTFNDALFGISSNGVESRIFYIDHTTGNISSEVSIAASQAVWLATTEAGEYFVLDAATDSIFQITPQTFTAIPVAAIPFDVSSNYRLDADEDPGSGQIWFFDEVSGFGGTGMYVFDVASAAVFPESNFPGLGSPGPLAIAKPQGLPYDILWTPSFGLSDPAAGNPLASPSSSINYILNAEDGCGVVVRDTVSVTLSGQISLQANNGTIKVLIVSGVPPYTFLWNTGDTTADLTIPASGIYTVTVTDSTGCEATDSIEVWATSLEGELQIGLNVFPNPSQGTLELEWQQGISVQKLSLFDLKGLEVWNSDQVLQGGRVHHIHLPGQLANGLYNLLISTDKGIIYRKLSLIR